MYGVFLQVSWVRHRDIHLLTVARYTYTSDQRFQAIHSPQTEDWTLQVRYPQRRDSGVYECQVSTTPPIGTSMYLSVVGMFWFTTPVFVFLCRQALLLYFDRLHRCRACAKNSKVEVQAYISVIWEVSNAWYRMLKSEVRHSLKPEDTRMYHNVPILHNYLDKKFIYIRSLHPPTHFS